MRSVTYAMGVSLGGYIVGPDGGFEWTPPDEELFRRFVHVSIDCRPCSHVLLRGSDAADGEWRANG